jgi:hypothetical protein
MQRCSIGGRAASTVTDEMVGIGAEHGEEGVGPMRIALPTALATVTVLAVGLLAGPAAAQEGFPPGGCEAAVVGGTVELENDDGTPFTAAEIEYLLEESGLTTEEICTIYGVEVGPVVEVPPTKPTTPPPATRPVAERPTAMPAEVRGQGLARTGSEIAVLIAVGLGVLGLGVLALRRTRGTSEG